MAMSLPAFSWRKERREKIEHLTHSLSLNLCVPSHAHGAEEEMRRSSSRLWSELLKELSRLSNLVWLVALLLWLAVSSSWYSHWHALSHHLLRNSWLSSVHNDHWLDDLQMQYVPLPSGKFSASRLRMHQLNVTDSGTDVMKESVAPSDLQEGLYSDNSDEENGDDELSDDELSVDMSHQEDDRISPDGDDHLAQSLLEKRIRSLDPPFGAPNDNLVTMNPSKRCASVEEMGNAATGTVVDSSLRVRKMINQYLAEHGALHVRDLPPEEFCKRGFVFGRASQDGLGNDIYKLLTASGLSMMLNRSLIIAEHGSTNPAYFGLTGQTRMPFGDYLRYSNQTFSLREVKRLWVEHDCVGSFQRPLTMIVDDFQRPTRTKVFCEDWTRWRHPIIWFKGTTDSNALQFFLKNRHSVMRESASLLFGDPAHPSSRPNAFGELFKAFISPMPIIEEAVQWALQGRPDPDISVHMRMLNSRSRAATYAVCSCIRMAVKNVLQNKTLPRVVIATDTPFIIKHIKEQLEGVAEVVHFDSKRFMATQKNLSKVMTSKYFQPPGKRVRDWGSMPRWVAIVDFFLAVRAKSAVISGANRRVGTTYAQLLASLAAARRTDELEQSHTGFGFFSSFHTSLVMEGLAGQRGWGHTWRCFAGRLSCRKQGSQCARTPLLPYAWWDGPWQSPTPRDTRKMLAYGIKLSASGQVEDGLAKTCSSRKTHLETLHLALPPCEGLKLCPP